MSGMRRPYGYESPENYGKYLKQLKKGKAVLLELGVGFNTPSIIRFPFEKMVREHKNTELIRLNRDEAVIPESFGDRGIGINRDLCDSLRDITIEIKRYPQIICRTADIKPNRNQSAQWEKSAEVLLAGQNRTGK